MSSRRAERERDLNRRASLYCRPVPHYVKRSEVSEIFDKYGIVRDVYLPVDYYTREPRGFAYIEFENVREAESALRDCDGIRRWGNVLRVEWARSQRKTPREMRTLGSGGTRERGRRGRDHGRRGRRSSYSRSRSRSRGRRHYSSRRSRRDRSRSRSYRRSVSSHRRSRSRSNSRSRRSRRHHRSRSPSGSAERRGRDHSPEHKKRSRSGCRRDRSHHSRSRSPGEVQKTNSDQRATEHTRSEQATKNNDDASNVSGNDNAPVVDTQPSDDLSSANQESSDASKPLLEPLNPTTDDADSQQ